VHIHLRHGAGMSQEIPEPFSAETGWPGEDDCALMTSITTPKEWPLCSKFLLCLLKQPKTQGTKVSRKTELVSMLVIVTLD
jgi:hypothetical protein